MKKNNISKHLERLLIGYLALSLASATILFAISLAKIAFLNLSLIRIALLILISYIVGAILYKKA